VQQDVAFVFYSSVHLKQYLLFTYRDKIRVLGQSPFYAMVSMDMFRVLGAAG
jgi:hypothetical protein